MREQAVKETIKICKDRNHPVKSTPLAGTAMEINGQYLQKHSKMDKITKRQRGPHMLFGSLGSRAV